MDRVSFHQLFEALPSPHMVLDRNLRLVAANAAYERAVMSPKENFVGRELFEVFPSEPANQNRLRVSINKVIETGEPDTIAYIRYSIPRPVERGGGVEERYWTAVHAPLVDESGTVIFVLQNTVDITELVRLRETASMPFDALPGEVELVQRAREAEAAYSVAREEGTTFERLFRQAPGIVAVLHGPDHVFTFVNDAYRTLVGDRDYEGQSILEIIPELRGQSFVRLLDEVFHQGVVHDGAASRILLRRQPGGPVEEVFVDFSFHPIRNRSGEVTGVFVQGTDRTDNVRFEQRQRLLLDELNHRVKNTLSSVQSMARQSFKQGTDLPRAQAAFESRIQALSKAHDALSDRHWVAVDLRTIALQELSAFGPLRASADGPLVRLSPKAAIAFAMVFHELASNAVKYGSLAGDAGEVIVRWTRAETERDRISIEWREVGTAPGQTIKPGFGTRMLERIVSGELEGELDLALGEAGLVCRIDVAITEIEDPVSVHDA